MHFAGGEWFQTPELAVLRLQRQKCWGLHEVQVINIKCMDNSGVSSPKQDTVK